MILVYGGRKCSICSGERGYIQVDGKTGRYGIAICPGCDYAHEHAAGPPPGVEHRARDFPDA